VWAPEFEIPAIELLGGFGVPAQDCDWTVDGDETWWKDAVPVQPLGWAVTEQVNEEKDRCPETPAREAEARGASGVGLGFDLVCGLFVHGESVAQGRRFNRRKQREKRGMGQIRRAGLMRPDVRSLKDRDPHGVSNDDHVPNLSEVPVEALLCRLKRPASAEKRRVDGLDGVEWDRTRHCQLEGGADAEDVGEENYEGPKNPAEADTALGAGGVGLGFDLVCGLFVHGESVAQKGGFNRRERSDEGERDRIDRINRITKRKQRDGETELTTGLSPANPVHPVHPVFSPLGTKMRFRCLLQRRT
jgi:hypothetical protein